MGIAYTVTSFPNYTYDWDCDANHNFTAEQYRHFLVEAEFGGEHRHGAEAGEREGGRVPWPRATQTPRTCHAHATPRLDSRQEWA